MYLEYHNEIKSEHQLLDFPPLATGPPLLFMFNRFNKTLNRLSQNRLLSQVAIADCYTTFNWLTKKFNHLKLNRLLRKMLPQVSGCKSQADFHKILILNTLGFYFSSFLDPFIFSHFFSTLTNLSRVWALRIFSQEFYRELYPKISSPIYIYIDKVPNEGKNRDLIYICNQG